MTFCLANLHTLCCIRQLVFGYKLVALRRPIGATAPSLVYITTLLNFHLLQLLPSSVSRISLEEE